ncbi:hypothetical protein [Rhodoferax antarcticus]|uniref:Uncharacterized protein n=1 Tax=Rhodoferax antarcticus ANT.BR TaxID=1111071 RepID=A0A1Q8YD75_9BURK|nr:hypothetical protein [Rhodoferax antarcticus]APW45891.1 hypothetical protein RA876_05370 [Rhodoferax antarcticus]MCW2310589.1 hypothetical protein [Rhodoferax antarcticus]OLP05994.1 hypothetical protein BLL52_2223 [Rhodoferax antarcticus ANT.BR]
MNPNPDLQLLEAAHPHIAKAIKLLWGHHQVHTYIARLFDDSRDNQRKGFSPEVMAALLNIQELHEKPADYEPTTWGDSRQFFR